MTNDLKKLSSDEFFDLTMDAFEDGDRKQTKWLLKKANKYFPGHHLTPYIEGLLAVTIEDDVKGLKLFTKSLAIKPGFALAHGNISICYKNLEKIPKMLYHAKQAIELADDDEFELLHQHKSMLDMVIKEIPNGLSLDEYIENGLLFDDAHDEMVAGNIDQAIELFEQVLSADEYLSPALGNLGICYLVNHQLAESRDYLVRALEVDPDYTPAKLTLAKLESIERGEEEVPKKIFSTIFGQHQRIS